MTSMCTLKTGTILGINVDSIKSQVHLEQLIDEPTHIIGDSFSCIDLIYTSQPNLVTESGVHSCSSYQKSIL